MTAGILIFTSEGSSPKLTKPTWPSHYVKPFRLPAPKPTIQSAKRRLSLPVVTSISSKQLDLDENKRYNSQQDLFYFVKMSCNFSLGFSMILLSHFACWIWFLETYMAIVYVVIIAINLAATLWIYSISVSLTSPGFHDKLYIAVTLQLANFVVFSILSFSLLLAIGLAYLGHRAFKKLVLWRNVQFIITNGLLTLFEVIFEVINIVMASKCRKQLIHIATQWSAVSWRQSIRSFSRNPAVPKTITNPTKLAAAAKAGSQSYTFDDSTIYYSDDIDFDSTRF